MNVLDESRWGLVSAWARRMLLTILVVGPLFHLAEARPDWQLNSPQVRKTKWEKVPLKKISMQNNTGTAAYDLHILVWSTDDNSKILNAKALQPAFKTVHGYDLGTPAAEGKPAVAPKVVDNLGPISAVEIRMNDVTTRNPQGIPGNGGRLEVDLKVETELKGKWDYRWQWTDIASNRIGEPIGINVEAGGQARTGGGGGGTGGPYRLPITGGNPGSTGYTVTGVSAVVSPGLSLNPDAGFPDIDWSGALNWSRSPYWAAPGDNWSWPFEHNDPLFGQQGGTLFVKVDTDAGFQMYGAFPISAVPEPKTWAMLAGLGLAGFAVGRRVHAQRAARSEHSKSS